MSAPSATKKRAAPKRAAPKKVELDLDTDIVPPDAEMAAAAEAVARVVNEDGTINPVRIGKRGRKGEDAPKSHHVFTLGTGVDEVQYFVNEPNVAMVMQYLTNIRKVGRGAAIETMAFGMLGEAALSALAGDPEVEPEDVADVFTAVGSIFFGSSIYKKVTAAPDPS